MEVFFFNSLVTHGIFSHTRCEVELAGVFFLQDSMGGSPNDIRISDMRPTLVEPPMYKPKVVLLGKDKKGIV